VCLIISGFSLRNLGGGDRFKSFAVSKFTGWATGRIKCFDVTLCVQLERSLVSGDVMNAEFSEEISKQHAGMTPLALASALNKLPSVKVWFTLTVMISCL